MSSDFIYDRYTSARGAPQLFRLWCQPCGQYLTDYQKDGPGPLLRCYVDRIQNCSPALRFTADTLATARSWTCSRCSALLAVPYMYQNHGEVRPAYLILSDTINGVAVPKILSGEVSNV